MRAFIQEFKSFIARGNVMDLAVGVIIGGAFSNITTSLVNDILNPILGIIAGNNTALAAMAVELPGGGALMVGNFINAILNFLIMAFAEKGGDPRTSPGALPGRAAAHRDPGPAEREDLMEEKKIPPQEEQDAPAPYTPASPVKRTMAWIGVVYMVILVAMMTYYYFTGSMLVNMAPLLAVPGLIGLGILALVSWRTTGRPGKWPAIALAAVCFLAALATLPLGIVGLLSNFSLVGVFVTGAP